MQEISLGPLVTKNTLRDERGDVQRQLSSYTEDSTVTKFKWLKLNTLKFMPNNCFIVLKFMDDQPQFGKVQEIIQINNNKFF